jgi:hypothetical protein
MDDDNDEIATRFRTLLVRRPEEIEREQLDAFYAALARALGRLGPLSDDCEAEGALCAAWFCRGQPSYMTCVSALVGHTRPIYMWDDHVRSMRACARRLVVPL